MSRPWRANAPRGTLADAEAVGEEDQVAFATFGGLGGVDVMVEADAGIGGDIGMPPGGEVIALAT